MEGIMFILEKVLLAVTFIFLVYYFFAVVKKMLWDTIAPIKTVKAELVDKYIPETISRYPKNFQQANGVVVFKTKDKKLSFYVSSFSYSSYRRGEKGTLKYKGSKLISFK